MPEHRVVGMKANKRSVKPKPMTFDTVRQIAQTLPGAEDLVNAAAVETLLHGGLVDILPSEKAPAPVAALLRY